MESLNQSERIVLCRNGSCCPVLKRVSSDEFILTDDFDGKVTLTEDQLDILVEKYTESKK